MIDVTECPIWTPSTYEWEYYSMKKKQHTLKYEVALSMKDHNIIWVNGPFKGSVHDSKICKNRFVKKLASDETAIGDKAYIGILGLVAPYKPALSREQKDFNLSHYKVRQAIERCNKRLKQFRILRDCWRMYQNKVAIFHKMVFYVICYVTQLAFIQNPLTKK
jgi:hypothetical protein